MIGGSYRIILRECEGGQNTDEGGETAAVTFYNENRHCFEIYALTVPSDKIW